MPYQFEEGEVLLIDKPYRWTSFDAVRKIRNSYKNKKNRPCRHARPPGYRSIDFMHR
jgi:hypothetical protein